MSILSHITANGYLKKCYITITRPMYGLFDLYHAAKISITYLGSAGLSEYSLIAYVHYAGLPVGDRCLARVGRSGSLDFNMFSSSFTV